MRSLLIRAIVILFLGSVAVYGVKKLNNPAAVPMPAPAVVLVTHADSVNYWTGIYSVMYQVPRGIMESVFYEESRWQLGDTSYSANVVGDGGTSYGVGQIKLNTAKSLWKDSSIAVTGKKLKYDIQFNVATATKFIKLLYDKYSQEYTSQDSIWMATLTAYNTGEGSFNKHKRQFNKYARVVYKRYINQ